MYHHMFVNSFFNFVFCVITIFSLMNVCIYPRTSFCSGIHKSAFSQYYKIYILNFFGESIRMCCNFSYFTFSISRFYISTSSGSNGIFFKKKNEYYTFFRLYFLYWLTFKYVQSIRI
jgi:hypothetical protein